MCFSWKCLQVEHITTCKGNFSALRASILFEANSLARGLSFKMRVSLENSPPQIRQETNVLRSDIIKEIVI